MSAVIRLMDIEAKINDYHWSSNDKVFEEFLNLSLDTEGKPGWHPDPDMQEAQKIIDRYGAELVENIPPKYRYNSRVDY